ncbi:MAG: tetratricopeptide repeat protein [Acidobacteriota bacterium]
MRNPALLLSLFIAISSLPAAGQAVPIIFRGTVVMADGTPPPKSVGIQKRCSDRQGDAPGVLTDKKGVYTWRFDVDFMSARRCFLFANMEGHESTEIEVSNYNAAVSVNVALPPIVLTPKGSDPYVLGGADKDVPNKARKEWAAAMKAVQSGDRQGAIAQLVAATAAAPEFALGWHNLGVLYDFGGKPAEARHAYTTAIEKDPKLLTAQMALLRLLLKQKDWDAAAQTAAALVANDKKRIFPDAYVHQAVALYFKQDYAGAEAAAREAINPKAKSTAVRGLYILGRIQEAKGDAAGAKQSMTQYLERAPGALDASVIKDHIEKMGQPGAPEPELELL